MNVRIRIRPLLVSGQLAVDADGPLILIDSEQPEHEQVVALWHETLHLLGLTDEKQVEAFALELAKSCPTILLALAPRINVPESDAVCSKGAMDRDAAGKALFDKNAAGFCNKTPWDDLNEDTRQFWRGEAAKRRPSSIAAASGYDTSAVPRCSGEIAPCGSAIDRTRRGSEV